MLSLISPRIAAATSYYWDTNGVTSGLGSAGGSTVSWLTNSWSTLSTGTGAVGAWQNTNPNNADEASFGGTAGTVTLGADVYANVLRFTTANYIVSSLGGGLRLDGTNPKINVSLPASNNVTTISAPLLASTGWTLEGNSLTGGLKFLVLANASDVTPNSFGSPFNIAAGGSLRIGGGPTHEQIPDNVDLNVDGVIDFITVGGASDMKQEKVRNVTVAGAGAIFSVGNGTDFVVNSLTATNATNVSVNGNQATVPGRLIINGWAGGGTLTLASSTLKVNPTSSMGAIGGRIVLSGNIASSGASIVTNNNGLASSVNTNTFTNKAFDFASAAHTINVADGTLTFTSASAVKPLEVTALNPSGTTLTKTGAGALVYENAVQTSFTGTNRVEAGTLRIGAADRLADNSRLEVAGGTFDLQTFNETVASVLLESGSIVGSGVLASAAGFDLRSGAVAAKLSGSGGVLKTTASAVQLTGVNSYAGDTRVAAGTLTLGQPSLADPSDVFLVPGATLDLTFPSPVTDTVHALFFDGVAQAPGTWGAIGSGAAHQSDLITGTGRLLVTTLGLAGDFDGSGTVNAVDLAQWTGDFGMNGDSDADGDGDSDAKDFLIWQANPGGTSPAFAAGAAVPEPGSAILVISLVALGANWRPRSMIGARRRTERPELFDITR